jgi:hypothetical protein
MYTLVRRSGRIARCPAGGFVSIARHTHERSARSGHSSGVVIDHCIEQQRHERGRAERAGQFEALGSDDGSPSAGGLAPPCNLAA